MIVYDTRDILDRARQIGNLENTSFITDDEELTLLNDCWVELYEKAAIKELLTTDDDINTLSNEYSKTIESE